MNTLSIPSDTEIDQTIEIIKKKIASGKLSGQVENGYKEAIKLLTNRATDYRGISDKLEGDQARAIAMLACDYQMGEFTQKVLAGIEKQEGEDY